MSKKKVPWYKRLSKTDKILFCSGCVIVLMLTIISTVALIINSNQAEPIHMDYVDFVEMAEAGAVTKAEVNFGQSTFVFYDCNDKAFETDNPYTDDFKLKLLEWKIEVIELESSILPNILLMLAEYALLVGLMALVITRMMPKTGTFESIKKAPTITFDDVAGEEELKKDLENIIEYLRDPEPFKKMGARMPRGLILYGPPGTGKTLTAKAMAGTAGVPFFSATGSDFIEMYVGLGAKRVRTLFKEARKAAPCIIFIDEIDAVGKRSSGMGSNSESNQTINALLNEMDGFADASGILVIAATNRLEDLDPALVRPGRFDKQLAVPLPDKDARRAIIEIHKKGKTFADDIDWETLLSSTIGFSGAALESLLNEAAFIAAGRHREAINNDDLDRAMYKLIMKGDRKEGNTSRSSEEIKVCAYHEAGHAVMTRLLTNDVIPQITIVSGTSGAGGVTFRTPRETILKTKADFENDIMICYAGRAEEQLMFGENAISSGASSDIRKATEILQDMICHYGMSAHGMVNIVMFRDSDTAMRETAEKMAKDYYEKSLDKLCEYGDVVRAVASDLIRNETLREHEIEEIFARYELDLEHKNNSVSTV